MVYMNSIHSRESASTYPIASFIFSLGNHQTTHSVITVTL